MNHTLSIRLDERDRATLEAEARRHGTGLSGFLRDLAEAEARRLRRDAVRAEGEAVMSYLRDHSAAREELASYGTPISDLP